MVTPVPVSAAQGSVKENYSQLLTALNTNILPVFFTYFGEFPPYLDYITEQLVQNLQDPLFLSLVDEVGEQLVNLISALPESSSNRQEFLHQHSYTDSFYHFKKDLTHIYTVNVKMLFIFIALREAVKGWAVAAKKLPSSQENNSSNQEKHIEDTTFIFDMQLPEINKEEQSETLLSRSDTQLAKTSQSSLEYNPLPAYIALTQQEFEHVRKTEQYIITRVAIEKIILASLGLLPHLIFSPINVTLELIKSHRHYQSLLYLLCEQFPTLVVQRTMFSGYLKKGF